MRGRLVTLDDFMERRLTRGFKNNELPAVSMEIAEAHRLLCGGRAPVAATVDEAEAQVADLARAGVPTYKEMEKAVADARESGPQNGRPHSAPQRRADVATHRGVRKTRMTVPSGRESAMPKERPNSPPQTPTEPKPSLHGASSDPSSRRRPRRRSSDAEAPSIKLDVDDAEAPRIGGFAIAAAVVLLVVAVVLAVTKTDLLGAQGGAKGGASSPDSCRKDAAARLPQAVNSVLARLGPNARGAQELADTLDIFGRGLLFDFRDVDESDFPPRAAMSLRLQGNDPAEVNAVFDVFLRALFSPACRKERVLEIDVAASQGEDLMTKVNSFLQDRKGPVTSHAVALIVFRNVFDVATVRRVMSFKDHLDNEEVPISGATGLSAVSARGTGFVFLGGSLPHGEECHAADVESHDKQLKWLNNMQGRVRYRARHCVARASTS